MRRIEVAKRAEKFLRQLPPKHGRQLAAKLRQLAVDPEPQDSKRLQGYPYLRADSGEYRIIYKHDEAELRVVIIGKRNDDEVYRRLQRLD